MIAVQCGLTIEKFWQITWRDFSIYKAAKDRTDLDELWKLRRIVFAINRTIPAKGGPQSEEQMWPLPIDKSAVDRGNPLTAEERKQMISRLAKFN